MYKLKKTFNAYGPGILFASTAIGVSHLVQSTRAGAEYGLALLWAIILANFFKYPFFEFGSRYAAATKETLLDGYLKIGKWALILYFIVTLGTMLTVTAAVSITCAGLLSNIFLLSIPLTYTTLFLYGFCLFILFNNKYSLLDNLIKLIALILIITTVIAFALVVINGPSYSTNLFPEFKWDYVSIPFLIALMGWMPTAVDLSAWNSIWTVEKIKSSKIKPSFKQIINEFNVGYTTSAFLAICFLFLGAYLMYESPIKFSNKSSVFASQLINLYSSTIGNWSYSFISISSFAIMFGTTIAVLDGYARSVSKATELIFQLKISTKKNYQIWLISLLIGGWIIVSFFLNDFKNLIDLATILSFIVAPFIAVLNIMLISPRYLKKQYLPPNWLKILSYFGVLFLSSFSIYFIYFKLFS